MAIGEVLGAAMDRREPEPTAFAWRRLALGAGRAAIRRRAGDGARRAARSAWKPASRWAMVNRSQADRLMEAGLTAITHNLDTGPEFYGEIHLYPDL